MNVRVVLACATGLVAIDIRFQNPAARMWIRIMGAPEKIVRRVTRLRLRLKNARSGLATPQQPIRGDRINAVPGGSRCPVVAQGGVEVRKLAAPMSTRLNVGNCSARIPVSIQSC